MIGGGLRFESLKVTDFGIAKMAKDEVEQHAGTDAESTAKSSTVMNALAYMAPEVINSPHKVEKAADVWAVCTIGWDLLTGAPPFGSALRAVAQILAGPMPTLDTTISGHRQFGPLASEIAGLLLKGMNREPSKRPTADQLAELFDQVCYLKPVREIGSVKNWWGGSWGFITADAGDDVFFHQQSVVGTRPRVGERVWFSRFEAEPEVRAIPVLPLNP
jgi:serine/threonine-protein kinase